MVSNRSRQCRCGCGQTFTPARPEQIFYSNACRMRERRTRPKRNKQDETGQEIRRVWGDAPVIDARKDLRVFIVPEDVDGAVPKAPESCVFARACQRSFQARKVLFFRSIAYIELPDSSGAIHVERFCLDPAMRQLVEAFDRGEGVVPKGGFFLRAPPSSKTLEGGRRKKAEGRARRRSERATLEGHVIGDARSKPGVQPLLLDLAVRSGTGAVHFTAKNDEE